MAKNRTSVTIGPTQPVPGGEPPNPADSLRTGQLGTRHFADQVQRRPFSEPTKSFLHRYEGPSNEEFNVPPGENVGKDANKYSGGDNPETTSQGEPIRGT